MAKSITELQEALTSVRTAIRSAESAQSYQTPLGASRTMANLQVLYARERQLEAELAALQAGGVVGGLARNVGRINR